MDNRVVAIIPARYQSTRLPGKPLADICGKPMIQRVYERTAAVSGIDEVIVATDDGRIRDLVARFGGTVAMTASSHVSGTDRIAEVAAALAADLIVNVQGDLPFLEPAMVEAALRPMQADVTIPMSTVRTPIRRRDEFENPNVVKVVTDTAGFALYFSRSPIPCARDGAEETLGFKHIGLYAYRREFLLTFARMAPTPLEQLEKLEQLRALERGFRIKVGDVDTPAIEVDTADDLARAKAFIERGGEVS